MRHRLIQSKKMLRWMKNAGHLGRCDFSCVKLVIEVFLFLSRSLYLRNILMLLMWDIGVGEWVWIMFVGSDGTVSIVKKKVNKRFVPELKKIISVLGFPCIWTFCISVYFYSCIMAIQHLPVNISLECSPDGLHNISSAFLILLYIHFIVIFNMELIKLVNK